MLIEYEYESSALTWSAPLQAPEPPRAQEQLMFEELLPIGQSPASSSSSRAASSWLAVQRRRTYLR
jgi:hypothetical protein